MGGSGDVVDRALVGLLHEDQPTGVGFLVGPNLILTCTHVLVDAVDDPDAAVEREMVVRVVFPLLSGAPERSAGVRQVRGDVALLRVYPPEDARALRLVDLDDVVGRHVRAFGFPAGRPRGVWAEGAVRGRTAEGRIQIEDERAHGLSIAPGFSGGPVVDRESGAVLGMTTEVESRPERRTSYALSAGALYDDLPALGEQTPQPNPFRGLEPFGEADADRFFGRDRIAADLVSRLDVGGVLVVTGPSGCGKTSLVQAGLLPRLRRTGVAATVCRPGSGSSPWRALAGALVDHLSPTAGLDETVALAETLQDGGVEDVLNRVLVRNDLRRLLLVVDQLDEALVRAPAETRDMLAALLAVLAPMGREPRVDLVAAVRSQQLDELLDDGRIGPAIQGHVATLSTPGPDELRDIVQRPLEPAGMPVYEEGLVAAVLDDVAPARNPLPLVEFALTLLWEEQERGRLTHDAYRELGGVVGAVAGYAEQVWEGLAGDPDDEHAIRWLLGQLVSPLPDGGIARRVVPLAELGDRAPMASQLARTRLVTLADDEGGEPTVELAHAALVDHWDRLDTWVEEDRDFRLLQDQIDVRAARWEEERQDTPLLRGGSHLLRGSALVEAQELLRRADDLTARQLAFIRASVRSFRRLMTIAIVGILVIGMLGVLTVRVYQQVRQDAATRRAEAAAQRLLATSGNLVEDLDLSVRAYRTVDAADTRNELRLHYRRTRLVDVAIPADDAAAIRTVGPNGAMALVQQARGSYVVYDLTRSPAVARSVELPPLIVGQATWVGPTAVAVAADGGIGIWDLTTGRQTRTFAGQPTWLVSDVTGRWLGWGRSSETTFRLVDLTAPDETERRVELPAQLADVADPATGDAVVESLLDDGRLIVRRGSETTVVGLDGRPDGAWTPPDSPWIAVDGRAAAVRCVDGVGLRLLTATGELLAEHALPDALCSVTNAGTQGVFSADGRHVALVHGPTSGLLVGPVGGDRLRAVPGVSGMPVSVTDDGRGGYRVVMDAADSHVVVKAPPPDPLDTALQAAADGFVTDDGRWLVLRTTQRLEVWDPVTRRLTARTELPGAALSLDGWTLMPSEPSSEPPRLAVAHRDLPRIHLLELPSLDPVSSFEPHRDTFSGGEPATHLLDYSDGRLLVTDGGTYGVWSDEGEALAGPFNLEGAPYGPVRLRRDHDELVVWRDWEVRRLRLEDGAVVPGSAFDMGPSRDPGNASTQAVSAMDPSGDRLLVFHDNAVEIWDLEDGDRDDHIELRRFDVAKLRFRQGSGQVEIWARSASAGDPDPTAIYVWQKNLYYGVPGLIGLPDSRVALDADRLVNEGWALTGDDHLELEPTDPQVWLDRVCEVLANSPPVGEPDDLPDAAFEGPACADI